MALQIFETLHKQPQIFKMIKTVNDLVEPARITLNLIRPHENLNIYLSQQPELFSINVRRVR